MPPRSAPETATLVDAQSAQLGITYATSIAAARAAMVDFQGFYDDPKLAKWARDLARQLGALQRQAAKITDSYLARATSASLGRRVQQVGPIDIANLRTGAPLEQVLLRPAETYRYRMWSGAEEPAAREGAVNRIGAIAETGVQLAQRRQGQRFLAEQKADGYRRVIHPELATHGSCGLCIAASDRRYSIEELLPIHTRCNCTVLGIFGSNDPGLRLNREDLDKLYATAGGTDKQNLAATRYKVDEHGELGPVLNHAGKPFRSKADVANARNKSVTLTDDQARDALARVEKSLANMRGRDPKLLAGPIAANENRARQLREQLGLAA